MPTNFIYDGTGFSNQPKTDLVPIGADDPLKHVQAVDWNTVVQAALDIQTFLRGGTKIYKTGDATKHADVKAYDGTPNGVLTAEKGSLCTDITNAKLYKNTDGATAWTEIGASGTSAMFDAVVNVSLPNGLNNNLVLSGIGQNTLVRATPAAGAELTGIAGGVDGKTVCIINLTAPGVANLQIDSGNGGSIAANQIILPASTRVITGNSAIWFRYDGPTAVWRMIALAL